MNIHPRIRAFLQNAVPLSAYVLHAIVVTLPNHIAGRWPPMSNEIVLIDLSSLFWTAFHATAKDVASDAVALTMTAVRRCAGDSRLVAVCLDKGRSFRKGLLPDYKAQRPEKDHSALNQLADVKRKLVDAGYLLWGADGFEADDVIATAATKFAKDGMTVHVYSADKDLLQLLSWANVAVTRTYNDWPTWKFATVVEKIGIEPEGLGDYLALCGDTSDNIEGAKGIGPKTAKKLLIDHYSLDGIYAKIEALPRTPEGQPMTKGPLAAAISTPAVIQSLWDNRAKVDLARKLVALRLDAPIKFDEIYEVRTPKAAEEVPDMDSQSKFDDDRISPPPAKDIPSPSPKPPAGLDANAADAEPARGGEAGTLPKEDPRPKDGFASGVAQAGVATSTIGPASASESALIPRVTDVSYERALEPMSLGQTFKLAAELYKAGLYARFATPQAIAAVIMRGRELRLGALTSLDAFHVVEGRPFAWAYLLVALAKSDPDCEYFQLVESSSEAATWETKNRKNPRPTRFTYTIQQAEKAGLLVVKDGKKPGSWLTRPEDQLNKTAGAKLARVEYPGSALGIISVEEAGLE
jgi:5'-3' exonuclease